MSDDIVKRLRDHERHAVHDQDDDCAEAADAIEGLARDLHETRLLASRLTSKRDELAREIARVQAMGYVNRVDAEQLVRERDEAYAAGRAEVTSAAKEIVRLRAELERWKDAADEQAGPIQALMDERNELLAEVVKLRALVRVLQADGPDPLGGRMDV